MADELIVIGFQGIHRASEVVEQLGLLSPHIDLHDAVAVYRTETGKLQVGQTTQPTGKEGATLGGLLGAILGLILTAPLTGGATVGVAAAAVGTGALALGATGAVVGGKDADDWKEKYGIPDDFVERVGGRVQVGESALFALVSSSEPERVADLFRGYGGRILWSTLSPSQARTLEEVLQPASGALD